MSDLSKEDVLRKFFIESMGDETWELHFREGGKDTRVAIYYDREDLEDYAEEDSLAYWMQVLKRTWDDEDFEADRWEAEGGTQHKILKFRGD